MAIQLFVITAIGCPWTGDIQLDESPGPADAVFVTACKRVGGYIPAPEVPGIGVHLDPELLGKAIPRYMPMNSPVRNDGSPGLAV